MMVVLLMIILAYILLLDVYPILVASSIICFMFLFSILGQLQLGAYIVAIGPILLLLIKYKTLKDKKYWISKLSRPDLILFLILFFVLYVITRYYTYSSWDEFSHWGLIVKNLYLHNKLPGTSSTVGFLSYPPGTAVFQYWVIKIIGYTESNVIFAQSLLMLLALTTLFWNEKWSNFNKMIVQFVVAVCVIYALNGSFTLLFVDAMLSVYFGMGIVFLFKIKKDNFFCVALNLLPVISVLYLIKNPGALLATVIALMVGLLYVITKNPAISLKRKYVLFAPLIIILLAGLYLPKQLWFWHLEDYNIGYKGPQISMSAVAKSLSSTQATKRDKVTLTNFKNAIFTENILRGKILGGRVTIFVALCLILLTVVGSIVFTKDKNERKQLIVVNSILFLGLTLYLLGLLGLYVYVFGERDGVTLAGFMRYSNIYTMGWLLSVAFSLISLVKISNSVNWKYIVLLIVALSTLSYLHIARKQFLREIRKPLLTYAEYFKNMDPLTKVYFIHNDSDGFEKWIFLYEVTPIHIQRSGWSLGLSKYGPGDLWTNIKSAKAWGTELKEYDFLVVSKSDKKFWNTYGSLFGSSRSNGIYKVMQDKAGMRLLLVKNGI